MPVRTLGTERVRGLDSIRFLCALWVFFGHGGGPPRLNPFTDDSLAHLILRGIYGNLWVGSAAVIIFFVISGFCIHYPYARSTKSLDVNEFYIRRFIRLSIPLAVAIGLSRLVGYQLSLFADDILWSLVAELIYYALYPLMHRLRRQFPSWSPLILLALLAAFGVAATNPTAGNYPSYGLALNWTLGLPCWLMGCAVAETFAGRASTAAPAPVSPAPVSHLQIWKFRVLIIVLGSICSVLRFHSPVGYPWTLNLFAIAGSYWLIRELTFRTAFAPPRLLESAGLWSYSLYLLHIPAMHLHTRLFGSMATPTSISYWLSLVAFVLGTCFVFYLLVERPSHRLAHYMSRKRAGITRSRLVEAWRAK